MANHVTRVEPSFSVKDYGASKFVDLVRAQGYIEVEQPNSGPVRVRLAVSASPKKSRDQEGEHKEGPCGPATCRGGACGEGRDEEDRHEEDRHHPQPEAHDPLRGARGSR